MIIRDYRPEDFIQIKELWKLTNIYVSERGDTPEVIQRCNAMDGKLLVMEDPASGILIGTSWMTYDGRRLFLHHFAINPSHQRKGFGRILAQESLKYAKELGCPVKLEVHNDNQIAIHLYKSLGFIVFEDYTIFMNLKLNTVPCQ